MLRFLKKVGQGVLWLFGLVAIGAIGLGAGQTILGARADDDIEARPLPVSVITIAYQDSYQQRRLFSGRVSAAQVADLGFQVGGEVANVSVEIGAVVEKGAALARLDPTRIELREREAAAQLAEAKALSARAASNLSRVETLIAQGFASEQELDNVAADAEAARERVRLLERSLARAREDRQDTTLRAPFAGYVVQRYVDAGATVAAGQAVVRINQQASLDAEIGVPANLAATIDIGDEFTLQADDLTARARVAGVSDDIDPQTRSRTVRLEVIEDPGLIPGGLVRLSLSQERQGVGTWVPLTALQEGYRGLWSVYVVDDESVIRRKDIEIISLADDRAYVTGTLEDGDRVVATSPFRFVPGQKVEVIREEPVAPVMGAAASSSAR